MGQSRAGQNLSNGLARREFAKHLMQTATLPSFYAGRA
ncbi:hypothetical protein AOR13_640 [Alteromonas stellipolaris LMG 21856]|nr:hypothetical protein AOR13_640 [Alteromonas stellipolaris LMG 21856]